MRSNDHSQNVISRNEFWGLILILTILTLGLFYSVLTGAKGFVGGDHLDQHYPWWVYLHHNLKEFRLPFWTSLMTCGFPLAAEGQMGVFYLPNLLFGMIAPPWVGYHVSIFFHFIIGGIFFYLWSRRLSLSIMGSWIAALIYVFGSARAGFFYNITSQRVLVWFPLSLWCIESWISHARKRDGLLLSMSILFSWLGGYQQYAAYATLFVVLYAVIRAIQRDASQMQNKPRKPAATLLGILGWIGLGIFFSAPQTLPFFQLVQFSCREGISSSVALVGSANPLGWICMVYPDWDDFFHTELYLGTVPLFLIFLSLAAPRQPTRRAMIILTLISYLCALGMFNPLFVLSVKILNFKGRIPSKFLYFTATFAAVLAGMGWDYYRTLIAQADESAIKTLNKIQRCFEGFLGVAVLSMLTAVAVLRVFKKEVFKMGTFIVDRFYIGSLLHPHSPAYYHQKISEYYQGLLERISLGNFYVLVFTALTLTAILFSRSMIGCEWRKQPGRVFGFLAIILLADLWIYSQHGVLGNLKPVPSCLKSESSLTNKWLESDRSFYRIYTHTRDGDFEGFSTYPNLNMMYGFRDIGGYSPLIFQSYWRYLEPFGSLNNSLRFQTADPPSVRLYWTRLNFLGVKYLLSTQPLSYPDATLLLQDNHVYLYKNTGQGPGFYFADTKQFKREEHQIWIDEKILLEHSNPPSSILGFEDGWLRFRVSANRDGFFVVAIPNYPGWTCSIDGVPARIELVNGIWMGVHLTAGPHEVRFSYDYWKLFLDLKMSSL